MHTSDSDAYGAEDIIGSYSTDYSQADRPQQHPRQPSNGPMGTMRPGVGHQPSTSGHKERERTTSKNKSDMPLDVIDRLDISGLYGGGCKTFEQCGKTVPDV